MEIDLDQVIDTRTLAERLDELENATYTIQELLDDPTGIAEETEEFEILNRVRDEVPEFEDGNTLIREDYWVEYVEEMLRDCGDIPRDGLPDFIEIDWEKTAANVACDYSQIKIDEWEYYFRDC